MGVFAYAKQTFLDFKSATSLSNAYIAHFLGISYKTAFTFSFLGSSYKTAFTFIFLGSS